MTIQLDCDIKLLHSKDMVLPEFGGHNTEVCKLPISKAASTLRRHWSMASVQAQPLQFLQHGFVAQSSSVEKRQTKDIFVQSALQLIFAIVPCWCLGMKPWLLKLRNSHT